MQPSADDDSTVAAAGARFAHDSAGDEFIAQWHAGGDPPSLEKFLGARPLLTAEDRLDVILIDQQTRWQKGPGPALDSYLARYPELQDDSDALLDLIYGEFRARIRLNLPVNADEIAERFPALADRLRRQCELLGHVDSTLAFSGNHTGPVVPFPAGFRFGVFDLIEPLAGGGMGRVYRARHRSLNRVFAVKMVPPEFLVSGMRRQRFQTEVRAVARLDHPSILPIFDVGELDGIPWFSTGLIENGDLEKNLDGFRNQFHAIAILMKALADGVQHAHDHGILHRDLKPTNILIETDGNPLIADFGLARILDESDRATQTGEFLGTPAWLPPESLTDHGDPSTVFADIYGLGAILYFLLTGRPPHTGETALHVLDHVRRHEPVSPRSLNPKVSRDLEMICLKALDRSPSRRYASAREFAADVDRFLNDQPVLARPIDWLEQQRRRIRRHPVQTTIGVAAVILLSVLAWNGWKQAVLTARLSDSIADVEAARLDAAIEAAQARTAEAVAVRLGEETRLANQNAVRLRDEAERTRAEALTARSDYRRMLYAASMKLAWEAWQAGDFRHADELLRSQVPTEGLVDHRGFEWMLLRRLMPVPEAGLATEIGAARQVKFSPDGHWLAAGGDQGRVAVFDLSDPLKTARREFDEQLGFDAGNVVSIDFDRASRRMLVATNEGTVRVFDVASGQRWVAIDVADKSGQAPVGCESAVFVANGALIAACARTPELSLFKSETGQRLNSMQVQHVFASSLASNDAGTLLAIGCEGAVELREVDPGNLVTAYEIAAQHRVRCVCLSGDGSRVAFGGTGGEFGIFETHTQPTGTEVSTLLLTRRLDEARSLSFSPDANSLAVADYSGVVTVLAVPEAVRESTESGLQRNQTEFQRLEPTLGQPQMVGWPAHLGRAYAVGFSPDGQTVASGGQDATVQLTRPADAISLPLRIVGSAHPFDGEHDLVFAPWLSPDNQKSAESKELPGDSETLLTGSVTGVDRCDSTLRSREPLIDVGKRLREIAVWGQSTAAVARSSSDTNSESPSSNNPGTLPQNNRQNSSPGDSQPRWLLAAGSGDGHLQVWQDGRTLLWARPETIADELEFSPDGHWLASLHWNGDCVNVLNSQTGELESRLQARQGHDLAFSPDSERIAVTFQDDLIVYSTDGWSQEQRLSGHVSTATCIAWSPDNRLLASGSHDRTIRVYDTQTWKLLSVGQGHGSPVISITFSPDSRSIVSTSIDGTIAVWQAASGEHLCDIWNDAAGRASRLVLSPDGRCLAARLYDGRVLLLDIPVTRATGK